MISLILKDLQERKNGSPPSSPDLNPTENLWSIVNMKLYEGGKQYDSKVDLWKAIMKTMSEIESSE